MAELAVPAEKNTQGVWWLFCPHCNSLSVPLSILRRKLYSYILFDFIVNTCTARTRECSHFLVIATFLALDVLGRKKGFSSPVLMKPSGQSWHVSLGDQVICYSSLPCPLFPQGWFSSHLQKTRSFTSVLAHYLLHLWKKRQMFSNSHPDNFGTKRAALFVKKHRLVQQKIWKKLRKWNSLKIGISRFMLLTIEEQGKHKLILQ